MSGVWTLAGRPAWAKLAWAPLAAAMIVDGALIGITGAPVVSGVLMACVLALYFLCSPTNLLVVFALVNAFINAFSRSVVIPIGSLLLNPSELLAIGIIPIGLGALLRRRAGLGALSRVIAPFVVANMALLVASLHAGRFDLEWLTYWSRSLSFAVLLLLAFHCLRSERPIRRFVSVFSWASLVPIAVGLYQAITQTGLHDAVGEGVSRIYGTWNHPNAYGFYLLMLLPLSLLALLEGTERRQRMLAGAWAGVIVLCIFLTYSRSAWLGVIVEATVISLAKKNWRLLAALAAVIGITLLMVPTARLRLLQMNQVRWAGPELGGNSVEWRLAAWQQATSGGMGSLLVGRGANAVNEVLGFDAHNDYLAMLMEEGIVGLAAHAWLQVTLLAGSAGAYRTLRTQLYRRLALALFVILVAFSAMSLTDNILGYFQLNAYLWILVGLVWALPHAEAAQAAYGRKEWAVEGARIHPHVPVAPAS